MIKAIVIIVIIFNMLACQPVVQANKLSEVEKPLSFVCLKSQSECDIETQYGHVSIRFSGDAQQNRIKTELPFHIQLSYESFQDDYQLIKATGFLEGKSMFMGKIPVFFNSSQSASNKGTRKTSKTIQAESLLASCSEEIMTWRLWVKIEILADGIIQQQDFFIEFDSERL